MSFINQKIGTSKPNKTGLIEPALSDFVNITGEFTNNYFLGYDNTSSSWKSTLPPGIERIPIISWYHPTYNNTSQALYDVNDNLLWRNNQFNIENSTYISKTASSGSLVPVTVSNWSQYFTLKSSALNGKRVLCEACKMQEIGSGESIRYQWGVGSSNLPTYTAIGNIAEQNDSYSGTALGLVSIGNSDLNVALKVVSLNGTIDVMNAFNMSASSMNFIILD